ncbi:uncharacterized protein LOC133034971 isoform X2 [Cannabis sativa]|uniref:uncharacterized protein LOC133034971 isoform X2 n=1 Tax=Cannabis sativa TaxID=3483 RepID=UPI0029CA920D|nr:uncharacterized protein LOC133034971 isoform X2 [Cannabis sativa]
MGALKLILLSSTTAPTTSTTSLCLLSPCPTRPFPFSLRALTPPFLHLRPPLFLSTSLPRCTSKLAAVESNNDEYDDSEEDFEDFEELEEEADGAEHSESESDALIDVESLEKEAIEFVREFSSSLSKELIIEEDVKTDRKSRRRQKTVTKSGNRAIVVDEPGVTRDRLYGRAFWGDCEFLVIDTGGVLTVSKSQANVMEDLDITTTIGMDGIPLASREAAIARMPSMIEQQATAAVEESSVIIFVVDGQAGLTAADEEIADWLRRHFSDKSIILAVNKCESPRKGALQAMEFWSLGFTPYPISAVSGTGTGELLDLVCSGLIKLKDQEEYAEEEEYIPAIAIVGRPNVGKSSILNALVGEDRTIVSPVSGTTRDAIDTEYTGPNGEKFRLIDTAGIRRRAAVASLGSTTEALSVNRAFRAVRRSDVVALVIEALACITEQDFKIAERIEKEGKGCLIVVNKWDTIPNKNQQTASYYEQDVREKLRILDWAPIVYSTAIAGQQSVEKVIVAASAVEKERSRRLSTAILNQVVQEALAFKSPPRTRGGRRGRVYYCTQAAIRPPTFVFFVNDAKLFPETYRRYMEKQLRTDAGFPGTPIRILWRSRKKMERNDGKSSKSQGNLVPRNRKMASAITA